MSNSTFELCKQAVTTITGFTYKELPITYLGCPLYKGRRRSMLFDELIKKIGNKIAGWSEKLLSSGGRITLMRHVLTSMPVYLFQVLQPPGETMDRIQQMFAKFLWGSKEERKGIHWCKWQRLCYPVSEGGIAYRRLRDTIKATTTKLCWQFRKCDSFWTRFMNVRYCLNAHPSQSRSVARGSRTWERLWKMKKEAERFITWILGKESCLFGMITSWVLVL